MTLQSTWEEIQMPSFPKLAKSGRFDVVVVGGGITGLTAAYLLKKAGKSVCLLEREQLAAADTGHTTAHLTYVTDLRLPEIAKSFGREGAKLTWQGGAAAINTIEAIVAAEGIDCEFKRVPGYLHASLRGKTDERSSLQEESQLAQELGFDCMYMEQVPHFGKPGIEYRNQAKFHPLKYLAHLAKVVHGDGCEIYEHSEVEEAQGEPIVVKVGEHQIECQHLFIATHVPLMGKAGLLSAGVFQSKLAPYSSYVIGAKLPKGMLPEADFWDTTDPYFYLRVDRKSDADYAIFGGEDHKTGQEADTNAPFDRLEQMLHEVLPEAKVDKRWSGQVIETNDGLPFMGETANGQFVGTGFSGNGMTFGTLTAMMFSDYVLGRDNPWQDLFDVSRKKLRGGTWDYVKENFDYPYYLVRDWLRGADGDSAAEVLPGQGKVIKLDGQRVACYRDKSGNLTKLSPVCTHMGCIVHWNNAETTWDCPCHGSRFHPTGEVMAGPAEASLEPIEAEASK